MSVYFSMIAENGEIVINRIKLVVGNIFERIIKENERIERVELDKEYYITIQDIPRVIEYYSKMIQGHNDDMGLGMVGIVRHIVLPSLQKQLDYQVSNDKKYIIKWD